LDLVKELGFDLQRDPHNLFFIVSDEPKETIDFSPEEASLLKKMVLTMGSKSNLKDGILRKIYLNSEIVIQGNHLLNDHLGEIVSDLSQAISQNKQVILKKYLSANSNNSSDRTHRFIFESSTGISRKFGRKNAVKKPLNFFRGFWYDREPYRFFLKPSTPIPRKFGRKNAVKKPLNFFRGFWYDREHYRLFFKPSTGISKKFGRKNAVKKPLNFFRGFWYDCVAI
jgi:hypothetical protein